MSMSKADQESAARVSAALNRYLRENDPELFGSLFAAAPRYRYYQKGNGPMCCWTVEKDEDGWYASFMYRPKGKGSRSNKASRWEIDEKTMRRHRKRKDAKARAAKLYEKANR